MRKKHSVRSYLALFAVLLAVMSIPRGPSLHMKGMTIAMLAPAWEQLQSVKTALKRINAPAVHDESGQPVYIEDEIHRLRLQNHLLTIEALRLKEILKNESLIQEQSRLFLESAGNESASLAHLLQLRQEDFRLLVAQQLQSVPAQVIFRSPSSWANSMWINVGKGDNESLGREVIAKDSPVVVGSSVIGVIDYVGKRQSRVRLITDSGLAPSVRAMRTEGGKTRYLAKGELRGSAEAAWRGLRTVLRGIGFNYDYADDEGPARDLRTGEAAPGSGFDDAIPIIKEGDLLITTGMDGLFPRGLSVATVSKIHLLKEGDYYYEIEAQACVKNLDDLTAVYVLPPLGYNADIRAPHIVR